MPESVETSQPKPPALALVVAGWMLVQAVVVCLAPSIRVWPHHPAPPQSLALDELVVVQMTVVALFCPLIDRWGLVVMMAAGVVFFDQAAAVQAAVPVMGAFRAALAVGVWIIGGRLANGNGRSTASWGPFVLTLLMVVPVLANCDTGPNGPPVPEKILSFFSAGPIDHCLRQIDRLSILVLPLFALPGFAMLCISRLCHRLSPSHSSLTPLASTGP